MILMRNRLVFGFIKKTIGGIFKLLYKLIALFNLQFTLLVLLVGLILYLTGVMKEGDTVMTIFYFTLAISVAIAVIATVKKVLGLGKNVSKSKGVQIVKEEKKNNADVEMDDQNANEGIEEEMSSPNDDTPKYYRVKQHAGYIMAEYPDRYELYKVSRGLMIKVRTDLKH